MPPNLGSSSIPACEPVPAGHTSRQDASQPFRLPGKQPLTVESLLGCPQIRVTFRDFIWILKRPEVLLSLAAPALGLLYAIGEHSGVWDRVFGRTQAFAGVRRLQTATGYPASWIYASGPDRRIFAAMFARLEPLIPRETLQTLRRASYKPVLITVGGTPLPLQGLPPDWEPQDRACYTPGHPLLLIFGPSGLDAHNAASHGKVVRVGTLAQLTEQLTNERATWRFYAGTLMVSLLALAFIVLRFALKEQEGRASNTSVQATVTNDPAHDKPTTVHAPDSPSASPSGDGV